jgi:O-glycosyl hydrolase
MSKITRYYTATVGVLAFVFATGAIAATITINKGSPQQTLWGIGGFFGSDCATTLRQYSTANQTAICDLLFQNSGGNAGFTAGRMIVNHKVRPDANTWDWSQDADQRWFVNQALSRGFDRRALLAAPWTPPVWMKSNGNQAGQDSSGANAYLLSNYYDAFAQFLYDWKTKMDTLYGIKVAGVSIQNEPDMSPPYAGCYYTHAQLDTVANKVCNLYTANNDTTLIGAPECCTVNNSHNYYADLTLSRSKLGYFPTHNYGGPGDLSDVASPTLCTEVCNQGATDNSLADALNWADHIHTNIKAGSVGYLFWRMVQPSSGAQNQGLIYLDDPSTNTYTVMKRFYAFAQFSRAFRYGDKFITTSNPLTLVHCTAAKNPSTGKGKLVLTNTDSAWSGNITVAGFAAGSTIKVWRTGTQSNMTPITPDIVCNSSGSFTYNAPDLSITTFIEQ